MIPLIIWGGTKDARANLVNDLHNSNEYLVTHVTAEKTSITISQVHELIHNLTGSMSKQNRVVWIEDAHLLTIPAQNALLKILEEPPHNTQFVLTTINKNSLIPTICSRSQMIVCKSDREIGDGVELGIIKQGMSATAGNRILLADSIGRKREDLVTWTSKCLYAAENKLRIEKSPSAIRVLTTIARLVHRAHIDLKTNVSPSLTMQHLFISLPHLKKG